MIKKIIRRSHQVFLGTNSIREDLRLYIGLLQKYDIWESILHLVPTGFDKTDFFGDSNGNLCPWQFKLNQNLKP